MFDRSLNRVNERLNRTLTRNQLLQQTTDQIRCQLWVSRVVIYYFYREWKGQVIIESLSHSEFSILGSTGADDCFNGTYAQQYLKGKILQVADVETSHFDPCHLAFLRSVRVRADLVAPIVVHQRLWGLLAAHHHDIRPWSAADVTFIQQQAQGLASDLQLMA
ncbi:GAF domain-containing protein [Synechococcus moorigangaii CMS01]|nr:GAF domain-containing protein [Synechococcus moorigangaii CMS01]